MKKNIQYSFQRYEKKYFLTPRQHELLLEKMFPYITADEYGKTAICNLYYDTDDWQLIRASIEKPVYKEKLRVRSYGVPEKDGDVFIELKKKYAGIVYKRRILTKASLADTVLSGQNPNGQPGQIEKEILHFQSLYRTKPRVFIGYDRVAFAGKEDSGLRITFDSRLRWRDTKLDLCAGDFGAPILKTENILMELKIPGAVPMWLCRMLSEMDIFPVSFSKYGACYAEHLLPGMLFEKKNENKNKNKNYPKKEGLCSA